jgi:pimeloyl-ACP methyl ester carboxylesterase
MYPPRFEWQNAVAARICLRVGTYSPGRDAKRIRCPLLVVVATEDAVTPPDPARSAAESAPRGELVEHDCGHFDVYLGEWFERVVADEAAFLRRALLGAAPRATAGSREGTRRPAE